MPNLTGEDKQRGWNMNKCFVGIETQSSENPSPAAVVVDKGLVVYINFFRFEKTSNHNSLYA